MEFLINIATFEALPMEEIYEYVLPIWDFQWTSAAPKYSSFERIGMEDRVFINALGSMFVFMMGFFLQIFLTGVLYMLNFYPWVDWLYKKVKIDMSFKLITFSFYYGAYIDLLIGAYINAENWGLYFVPFNFGFSGNLNYSD